MIAVDSAYMNHNAQTTNKYINMYEKINVQWYYFKQYDK